MSRLHSHAQVGRELRESTGQGVRVLEQAWEGQDSDHVALLCKETLELGKSVLIFCATKKVQIPHGPHSGDALKRVPHYSLASNASTPSWSHMIVPKTLFWQAACCFEMPR